MIEALIIFIFSLQLASIYFFIYLFKRMKYIEREMEIVENSLKIRVQKLKTRLDGLEVLSKD